MTSTQTTIAKQRLAAGVDALLAGLWARLEPVERRTAGASRPRVVSIKWLDPVMLGGTWMPELITIAGGDRWGGGIPADVRRIEGCLEAHW